MHLSAVISGLISAATTVVCVQLPNLTGTYPVGTIALELVDHSRLDPLAPTPQPRALMVSLFYPTSEVAALSGNYSFAPYMPPLAAAALDGFLGAPAGTAEVFVTQSYLDAPLLNTHFPVLLFSHALSASRLIYTAELEDLASHGWVIIAVDHTYEALVVEFPDGTLVQSIIPPTTDISVWPSLVDIRVRDLDFVLQSFRNATVLSQIPGMDSFHSGRQRLHTHKVGVFGHSLGGASSAQAMSNFTSFACGANLDGTFVGPVRTTGVDKPFLLMTHEGVNRTVDLSWADFWDHSSGFLREFTVAGTIHESFSDLPLLNDLLGDALGTGIFGTIGGERLVEIETSFIDAFFAYCFKGEPARKLDKLAGGIYPEVSVGH